MCSPVHIDSSPTPSASVAVSVASSALVARLMLAENSPSFTCMPGAPISRAPFSSAYAHPSARHQPLPSALWSPVCGERQVWGQGLLPAGDDEVLTGDPLCARGSQEDDHLGDVARVADP